MTKQEFENTLQTFYSLYIKRCKLDTILTKPNLEELKKLEQYILANQQELFPITINNYQIKDKKIIISTDQGTFLLDRPSEEKLSTAKEVLSQKEIDLLTFYQIISTNNLNIESPKYDRKLVIRTIDYQRKITSKSIIEDFVKAYLHFRLLNDKYQVNDLFCRYNQNYNINNKSIPLEILQNPEFNNLVSTNKQYAKELQNIYQNYFTFDNNKKLIFSMIILEEYSNFKYLKKHIKEFKNFIIEESSKKEMLQVHTKMIYSYLKRYHLLEFFTKEELEKLYKNNPCYYTLDEDFFKNVINGIENKSPMIRLSRDSKRNVHIRYHDYDSFDGVLIKNMSVKDHPTFTELFLIYNETVVILYKLYYQSYVKAIKNNPDKNNLYDFIECLLQPKNLSNIHINPKISITNINHLKGFFRFYSKKLQQSIKITEENCRQREITIHNMFVKYKNNPNQLENILSTINLTKDTIFEYTIQNKLLDDLEKEAILKVLIRNYKDYLKLSDILPLINESIESKVPIETILSQHQITRKIYEPLFKKIAEKNPILNTNFLESLTYKERQKYLKIIEIGYKILSLPLNSLSDYQNKFANILDFETLLIRLDGTELVSALLKKAKTWPDFSLINNKSKTLSLTK